MKLRRSPLCAWFALAAGLLAAAGWLAGAPRLAVRAAAAPAAADVFINELHYDNAGTDSGEGVEVAAPTGTDLAGWSLVLYNGGDGAAYNTRALSGVVPDLQNGFGVLFFAWPANGLQNGPDGVALVAPGGSVAQFISYEGAFTATGGPAAGMVSTYIGVDETGSDPVGTSLQLAGSGRDAAGFAWAAPSPASSGLVNAGQHFLALNDLVAGITGPVSGVPGGPLRYALSVRNSGLAAAAGRVLTGTLPTGSTFAGQASPYPFSSPAAGVLVWQLGEVPSGTLATIALTATLDGGLSVGSLLTASLQMAADAPGDDPFTNQAAWVTVVRAPRPYPYIELGAPLRADPGSVFTYTLRVENDQAFALAGVVISDSLPAGVSYARAGAGGVLSNGAVRWDLAQLAAYAAWETTLTVTATNQVTTVVNTAFAVSAANAAGMLAGSPAVTVVSPELRIRHVQGRGHVSLLAGLVLDGLPGVVTARRVNGFYLQDAGDDGDPATSEAVFVSTGGAPLVQAGDAVSVSGLVEEYYPGGFDAGGLPTTRIAAANADVVLLANGAALPAPVRLGQGGRVPPAQVIEDDAAGNVETGGVFDPLNDGIDFYESLEGMRVSLQDALAVAGTDQDGQIAVVGDGGAGAGLLSAGGTLAVQAGDFNPERIILDDAIQNSEPQVSAGAFFGGVITGVLDYSDGNFKFINTSLLPPFIPGVVSETVAAAAPGDLSVAAFNLENLDPADPPEKFAGLAIRIVDFLRSPDILVVEEVQDNSGTVNDGVVSAAQTFDALVAAIQAAGGPLYEYRSIDPQNNRDGGDPGGNIRTGFLFRADRVAFVDRPGGDALTPVAVAAAPDGLQLSFSPGRIDPANPAFLNSRKPLAGEFLFNGNTLFVIACHFNSKSGDPPLFGRIQPPPQPSLATRIEQAGVVNAFVAQILSVDATAKVIVLGDLNDFDFSASLAVLKGSELTNLVEGLPPQERYSYVHEGNAQAIDHILVSAALTVQLTLMDMLHVDAGFPDAARPSDHDPLLARFSLEPVAPGVRLYLPLLAGGG